MIEPQARTRRGKKKEMAEPKKEVPEEEIIEKDYTNFNKGIYKYLQVLQDALEEGEPDELIASSVKTQLLFRLMENLKQEGHRILIFSMSKRMLDLLELIIEKKGLSQRFKHIRIDGDTEIADREQLCKKFNNNPDIFAAILTTKVGGFGLNLTGADRAIIMDPDWNPANDNQAVDRCYRIR